MRLMRKSQSQRARGAVPGHGARPGGRLLPWLLMLLMLFATLVPVLVAGGLRAEPLADAFSRAVTQTAAMPGGLVRALDWRLGLHPDRGRTDRSRFVLELSEAVPYRVFVLGTPYRVVIDLPRLDWTALPSTTSGSGFVAGVRQGWLDAHTLRLVLDVKVPVRVVGHEILPARDGHRPRLVVDVAAVPEAEFRGHLSTVFGTLGRPAGSAPGAASAAAPGAAVARPAARPVPRPVSPAAAVPAAAAALPVVVGRSESARADRPDRPDRVAGLATGLAGGGEGRELAALPALRPGAGPGGGSGGGNRRPLIVLDPGHGGIDPGAIGVGNVREKEITLAAARVLRQELERSGRYRVAMTRNTDTFIRLRKRVAFARERGADLFISLHADSLSTSDFRGMSIYTLSETASDREAEQIAANENRADAIGGIDLTRETDVVASILIDLAQRDTLNHSRRFARQVVDSLKPVVPLVPKPQRSAGFAVLTAADVPSVLIELGYLTNVEDARVLTDPETRRTVARALLGAIDRYFDWVVSTDNS